MRRGFSFRSPTSISRRKSNFCQFSVATALFFSRFRQRSVILVKIWWKLRETFTKWERWENEGLLKIGKQRVTEVGYGDRNSSLAENARAYVHYELTLMNNYCMPGKLLAEQCSANYRPSLIIGYARVAKSYCDYRTIYFKIIYP